jgi:hypothetical protein
VKTWQQAVEHAAPDEPAWSGSWPEPPPEMKATCAPRAAGPGDEDGVSCRATMSAWAVRSHAGSRPAASRPCS